MEYYKVPLKAGDFDYPAGCILSRSYQQGDFQLCEFEKVISKPSDWVALTKEVFEEGWTNVPAHEPIYSPLIIASDAKLQGGMIVLTVPPDAIVGTGTSVKFKSPCASDQVTRGINIGGTLYQLVDALNESVQGVSGMWEAGALLEITTDKENKKAFLQGGGTQSEGIELIEVANSPENENLFENKTFTGEVAHGFLARVVLNEKPSSFAFRIRIGGKEGMVCAFIDAGPDMVPLTNTDAFANNAVHLMMWHQGNSAWVLIQHAISDAFIINGVSIEKGGTGAMTADEARKNLDAAPAYTYGAEDLQAGSSSLETGKLHFVYE